MKKTKSFTNRLLSLTLAAALVFSAMSATALAADDSGEAAESTVAEVQASQSDAGEVEAADDSDYPAEEAAADENAAADETQPSEDSAAENEDGTAEDEESTAEDEENTSEGEDGEEAAVMVMSISAESEETGTNYTDGTYTGSGTGYNNGTVTVEVTVENGKITNIETVDASSQTTSFWEKAVALYESIISAQSTEVDSVSGATYSSEGIKAAVADALSKAVAGFSGGSGTESDPYLVSSEAGLLYLQAQVADGTSYEGQYIELTADIELTAEWTPIGDNTNMFAGTFDGGGYTISGLSIGTSSAPSAAQYAGLFGYVASGTVIRNITLENVSIYTEPASAAYAGALVAFMKADSSGSTQTILDNCHVSGVISVNTNGNAIAMVGGLAGFSNQYITVSSCSADVNVSVATGSKQANVGGLIGFESVKGLLINSASYGSVTSDSSASGSNNVGGLVGGANGMIYNCCTAATVTAEQSQTNIGAFAGNFAAATLAYSCYYSSGSSIDAVGSNGSSAADSCAVTAAELGTSDFASLLSGNLTAAKLSEFSSLVEANASSLTGCDFDARVEAVNSEFYDWTLSGGAVVLSGALWASSEVEDSIFDSGSGTEDDPYIIKTEEQLRAFAVSLTANLDYSGIYIQLGNDIALTGGDWTPVGEGMYAFNGCFDGQGCTISGLQIGSAESPYADPGGSGATMYFGLFGVLEVNAEVRDLNLDVAVYVSGVQTIYVSGLAGYIIQSLVDGVTVSGTIEGTTSHDSANIYIGGIGGYVYKQKIINSCSTADVRAEAVGGIAEAGGICGLQNRGLIANCYSAGNITGTADRDAEGAPALGGIAGVHAGTIVNCYSNATVIADCYTSYVGVLAGWATGIADTFQSYYSTAATLVTDDKTADRIAISPAVAIGWSVGPGINDEGEPYTGSVSLNVEGLSAAEMSDGTLLGKLNANFAALNVDLTAGGRQSGHWTGSEALAKSLKQWTANTDSASALPAVLGLETAAVTYDSTTDDAIAELLPDEVYYTGDFYGRSDDASLILKVTVGSGNAVTAIEVVDGTGDYSAEINAVIAGETTADDLTDGAFKQALTTALEKAEIPDYSGYGVATDALFASGTGTESDPWIIETEEQLRAFVNQINEDEDYSGKYITLGADIALTSEWTPAGGGNIWWFSGCFDGCGHTISGMTIGSEETPYTGQYAGLFAYINGGTVKNLTLTDYSITVSRTDNSRVYIGGLAAAMDQSDASGYLDGIDVSGTITVHTNSGAAYAGGILGQAIRGSLTNSHADVTISAVSDSAWVYAGGLAAMPARCGMINNYAEGSITASGPVNKVAIGGLSGFQSGVVYNCYTSVALIAASSTGDVGGLAGRNTGIAAIYNSYYDASQTQQSGGSDVAEKSAVGTEVTSETDGCGVIEGVEDYSSLSADELAAKLNANLENTELLDTAKALLSSNWSTSLNSDIELREWAAADGTVTFAAALQGSGTAENPYRIYTAEELDAVRSDLTAHYILMNDIDLSAYSSWEPIGTFVPLEDGETPDSQYAFTGVFDGQGYTVSNLTIEQEAVFGLFGCVSDGGTVKSLVLDGANISGTFMGSAVVGYAAAGSTVSDVTLKNSVISAVSGESYGAANMVGGIIGGGMDAAVTGCTVNGVTMTVQTIDGAAVIGGNVHDLGLLGGGLEGCTISNCTVSDSSLTLSGDCTYAFGIGGLSGCAMASESVTGCTVDGVTITAGDNVQLVGGLVGYTGTGSSESPTEVSGCAVTNSSITVGKNAYRVGGMIGGGFYFDEYAAYYGSDTVYTVDSTCKVENTTIKAGTNSTSVGKVAGKSDGSTVDSAVSTSGTTVTIASSSSGGGSGSSGTTTTTTTTVTDVTDTAFNTTPIEVTAEAVMTEEEAAAAVAAMTDVDADAYYADAIAWALEYGITTGTSDSTFDPSAECTRAQIVTFLYRMAGSPAVEGGTNVFADVDSDAYYYNAILWAIENGITNGTSSTTFDPDAVCTRAQIVTFLHRFAGQPDADDHGFVDVDSDDYYNSAVAWAYENGITTGTSDSTFSPADDCTRAQVVTFLYRYAVK
ncbi:MAG: S-layer homology domain-containing protein [Oscillospiraceae bacterium]|nr:S-layer homology domain-containing protein [Oscillospiraceae bacterium]